MQSDIADAMFAQVGMVIDYSTHQHCSLFTVADEACRQHQTSVCVRERERVVLGTLRGASTS